MSLVFPNPLIVLILAMTLPLACPSASAQNSPVAEPAPEGRSGELPDHTRKKLTAEEKESRAREKQSYLDEIATRGEQAQPLFVNALQDMQMPPEEGVPIFIALLSAKSQAVQDRAMFVLATEFKKDAVPAVPMILEFLRSPSLRSSMRDLALKTLAEIGPGAHEAVPLLTQFLAAAQKNSLTDRTNLIVALGRMGTAGASSLQTLRSYLKDPQVAVQYAAFEAIGTLQDPEPITQLKASQLKSLASKSSEELFSILKWLREARTDAEFFTPVLLDYLDQEPPGYGVAIALEGLACVGGKSPDVARALVGALGSLDEFISHQAAAGLLKLDSQNPELVPIIAEALTNPSLPVRRFAAIALRRFGHGAAPATAALATALKDVDSQVPDEQVGDYLETLKSIGPGAAEAAGTLIELLPERSPIYLGRNEYVSHHLQAYMLVTLAEIGAPKAALPAILDGLANSNDRMSHVYAAAARAAAALGPDAREAVPFLLRALKGEIRDQLITFEDFNQHRSSDGMYTTCKVEALRALAKIGAGAREAVPAIRALLEKPGLQLNATSRMFQAPDVSEEARHALQAIAG